MATKNFSLALKGAGLQAKAGLLLCAAYLELGGLATRELLSPDIGTFLDGTALVFFFGCLPSGVLGAFTGLLIGWLLSVPSTPLSKPRAIALGMALTTGLSLLWLVPPLLLWKWSELFSSFDWLRVYVVTLGLPSLIFVVASGWIAAHLHSIQTVPPSPLSHPFASDFATQYHIAGYIRQYHLSKTRYEIDLYLLNSGCNPYQLELAWREIEAEQYNASLLKPDHPLNRFKIGQLEFKLTFWKTLFGCYGAALLLYWLAFPLICLVVIGGGASGAFMVRKTNPVLGLSLLVCIALFILFTVILRTPIIFKETFY